jgi:hypothetical protein
VPIKTLWAFAPMSDINTAKASTKTRTITEDVFLLILIKKNRRMGMSRMTTIRQMAMMLAQREILALEKR